MRTLRRPTRSCVADKRLEAAIFRTPVRDVLARYRAERAAQSNGTDNKAKAHAAARPM